MRAKEDEQEGLSDQNALVVMLENAELEFDLLEETENASYEIVVEKNDVTFYFDWRGSLINIVTPDEAV